MRSVEWNKKEELVAEQAMKYLKVCKCMSCNLFANINTLLYELFFLAGLLPPLLAIL